MKILITNDGLKIDGAGYSLSKNQLDTEQKVLAWVYQFTEKAWMDLATLRAFIEACQELNPNLDIHTK